MLLLKFQIALETQQEIIHHVNTWAYRDNK